MTLHPHVCCLAAIEMQQLGISTKKDMVKLRSECANYGIRKPQRSQSECADSNFAILEMAKPSSIKLSKTSFGIINLGVPHSL
jgi:hypothetical protein